MSEKTEKIKKRSDYNNVESYDDELELVLRLLQYCKEYEREIIEYFEEVYVKLCELYEKEFPFYFKNGVDGHKLNELLISLLSSPGQFDTRISELLDEIERETRQLEVNYLMAWLMLDYEMTAAATAKSIGVDPAPYLAVRYEEPKKMQNIIERPWCPDGKTYIDRVRDATSTMDTQLRRVIVQGIQRGWSVDRMSKIFKTITGTAEWKARRLIRTETMAVYSKVTKDIYLENGIDYVEIIGDAECGGICLDYVGEAIPLKEAEIGDDLPPYHPNCACSFCAYKTFDEE